jgi:diaminohydroxyphosphoribosylaminopyrimidine deaminase / 5-amino-6-(5-phosphoribosylamino)uracil reductase
MIIIGRGTYTADTPSLTVRLPGLEGRSPRPALLTHGKAPPGWDVINSPESISALTHINHILIEGGAGAAAAFIQADLVDRLLLYRAPILIGGGLACLADIGLVMLDAAHGLWQLTDTRQFGADRLEIYERHLCLQA